jgi:signal peptidase I
MKQSMRSFWKEYRLFLALILLMVLFRTALADWNTVPTGSMKPTILEGDRILVNKMAYDVNLPLTHVSLFRIADPERGDIVIFDSQAAGNRLVKRVIGLPGDVIELKNNRLLINGVPAKYSDLQYTDDAIYARETIDGSTHRVKFSLFSNPRFSNTGPLRVPLDHYLVLGDNRDNSADSRVHGFVPRSEIIGSSKKVVMSLDYDNYYLPRPDRFFHALK